jgi:hypothetical protein
MRKLILGLLTAAIVAAPVTLTVAPAQADLNGNRHCMLKYEWRQIDEMDPDHFYEEMGSTWSEVRQIVGNAGFRISYHTEFSDGTEEYDVLFRQCMPQRSAWLTRATTWWCSSWTTSWMTAA